MAKYKRGSLALARQVFNTPQLILAEDLQNIAQFLVNRANGVEGVQVLSTEQEVVEQELAPLTEREQTERQWRRLGITNEGKRGNLEVIGTLVAKSGEIDADCMELTSYEKLYSTFQQQVQQGVEELVLHVDSGGGSAFSCFEMAKEVKDLAVKNGIKIYAFVDGLSASAAYAWTSIADEIVARKGAEVGSVGVVVQLVNNSKMLENIGITRQFVTHGENKVPFTDSGDFSPQFISSIQKKVNKTGLEFNTFVAQNRNMNVEDVIATQAEVFDADSALKVGFIDKIMTKSEFFNEYLPSQKSNQNNVSFMKTEENMTTNTNLSSEELQTQLSQSMTQLTDLQTQLSAKEDAYAKLLANQTDLVKQVADLTATNKDLATKVETAEKATILADRKQKLQDVLGKDSEKVASILTSTETLDSASFDIIVSTFSTTIQAQVEQHQEVGDEGMSTDTQSDLAAQIASFIK